MGLELQIATTDEEELIPETNVLLETEPAPRHARQGRGSRRFRGHRIADHSNQEGSNREVGEAGELLVISYETKSLVDGGRPDLAKKIVHTSLIEGDGAGYDVKSFALNVSEKYLEVKTTKGGIETPFQITMNEVEISKQHEEQFYLYRVYSYNEKYNSGKLYVVKGNIKDSFTLAAIVYRADRSLAL